MAKDTVKRLDRLLEKRKWLIHANARALTRKQPYALTSKEKELRKIIRKEFKPELNVILNGNTKNSVRNFVSVRKEMLKVKHRHNKSTEDLISEDFKEFNNQYTENHYHSKGALDKTYYARSDKKQSLYKVLYMAMRIDPRYRCIINKHIENGKLNIKNEEVIDVLDDFINRYIA